MSPNGIYRVVSLHVREDGETREILETQRTDEKTAYEDANIIRGILHRKAWVLEPKS